MKTIKYLNISLIVTFGMITWLASNFIVYGQQVSNFESYHPPYYITSPRVPKVIHGKWFRNSINSDSIIITCYIKKYNNASGLNVADTIYRKSISTWNNVFQQANVKMRFDIQSLSPTNPDSIIGDLGNSRINILGIGNSMISSEELTTIGRTQRKQDTIEIDGQKFNRTIISHIELNEIIYKGGHLPTNGKTDRSSSDTKERTFNAYVAAFHEIGHLLGLDHNVLPSSVMQPGYRRWIQILEDYDGIGDIPIQPIDEKYMRAIYSQFFLTEEQKNSSCLPRSTR